MHFNKIPIPTYGIANLIKSVTIWQIGAKIFATTEYIGLKSRVILLWVIGFERSDAL